MSGFFLNRIYGRFGIPEGRQPTEEERAVELQIAQTNRDILQQKLIAAQAENANYQTEFNAKMGLTATQQAREQALKRLSDLEAQFNELTMDSRVQGVKNQADLTASEIERSRAGTAETNARTSGINLENQSKQLELARALGAGAAKPGQFDQGTIDALTNDFMQSNGIPDTPANRNVWKSQATSSYLNAQDHLNQLETQNSAFRQVKGFQNYHDLVSAGVDSSNPELAVEGAARFMGINDPQLIQSAKQGALTAKQAQVIPREDAISKELGSQAAAAFSEVQQVLKDAKVGSPDDLKPGARKNYDSKLAAYEGLRAELDKYQRGATERQIPKTKGGGSVSDQNKQAGLTTANLPKEILDLKEDELPAAARAWGFTVDEIKAEIARRRKASK